MTERIRRALFVGGPLDGQWIALREEQHHYYAAIRRPLPPPETLLNPDQTAALHVTDRVVYEPFKLRTPARTFEVYIPVGTDPETVVPTLLQGYRPD